MISVIFHFWTRSGHFQANIVTLGKSWIFRKRSCYQIRLIFGKIPNGLQSPPPSFLENYIVNLFRKTTKTRTNCSRMVSKIESGSWERWLGWLGWQMIIWKRPIIPDDHLQVAGPSFASGRILRMIICKRPNPPDDHLQVASPSRWSFASGQIL